MPDADTTSWELLRAAAAGSAQEREEFARRYGPFLRDWLTSRWRATPLLGQVEDVVHEVFLECLKPAGVLRTALDSDVPSFRAFLVGVVRNLAMRHEARIQRRHRIAPVVDADPDLQAASGSSVSRPVDRAWALAIVRAAADKMRERAARLGASARMRVEILNLRFQEDLQIAAIAQRLGKKPSRVHHLYAKARTEFRTALEQVLRERCPGKEGDLLARCKLLMELLH